MAKSKALVDYDFITKDISRVLSKKKKRKKAVAELKKMATKLLAEANAHEGAYSSAEKSALKALAEWEPKIKKIRELEKEAKNSKGSGQKPCDKEMKKLEAESKVIAKRANTSRLALELTLEPVFFAANDVQNGSAWLLDSQ